MSDPISPQHYKGSGKCELIEITGQLDFCRGNAVKYLFRAGKKPGQPVLQDLKKALWYVTRAIRQEEDKQSPPPVVLPNSSQVNPEILR